MNEYTPSDAEIRDAYVFIDKDRRLLARLEFRRWLAAHDAEVAANALEQAATAWAGDPDAWGDNEKDYRNELRDRAEALREATS